MKEGPKQRSHAVNLAERLVEKGVLTEEQMRLALGEQERRKLPLRRIVVDLGLVSPEKLARFLAEEAHAEFVDINRYAIDFSVFDVVPPKVCRQLVAVPFDRGRRTLRVAMADPLDVEAVDTLRQISGMDVEVYAAPEPDIMAVLERRETAEDVQEVVDELIREEMRDRVLEPPPEDVVNAEEEAGTAPPIIQLVNRIIMRAIEDGASDIHFEPQPKYFRVRMRIDGVLSSDLLIPKGLQSAVTARLKILGNMDVAETRLPQDGRATVLMARRLINLRLSSLPSSYGENLVIRILDTASQLLSIQNLGLAAETQERLWEIIHKPYGVLIVTGPTGSGKTTTLYSILNELNTPERGIFTLEDPIEFRMQGLCQTEVREDIGLTFEAGLRSLLRQDPDIILVGETRDTETARLMVRAALTGHLVFTTLHTNDAVGAIPRLLDMGVENYLLPGSLLGILAQRLVRRLCEKCREAVDNPAEHLERHKVPAPEDAREWKIYEPRGCNWCRQTGYRGRHGVFELLPVDSRFHEPILRRASAAEIQTLAEQCGMKTLFSDGLRLVKEGITDLREVFRVAPSH